MIALPHSLTQYLLESSLCLALFFALYQLLLKRETFFQLNRLYLLLAPLIAFLIPLMQVGWSSGDFLQAEPVVRQAQQVRVELYTQIHTPSPQLSLSVADVLLWIYGLGAAWMLLALLRRLWALLRIIKSSKRQRSGRVTLLQAREEVSL
jgi:hypothetical protein